MSEMPAQDSEAPKPRDMTPVRVPDAPAPPPEVKEDGPRDLTPISWGGTYDADSDFRPQMYPVEASDPKDSPATVSADFSETQEPTSSPDGLATTADAARASKEPKVGPSKQPSLPAPKSG